MLATGDTIGMLPGSGRGAFAPGAELLADLPEGAVTAEVTVEDVLAEPSWNLEPSTMLSLARRVRAAILEEAYTGVVVTHGIDTLEETAYLIDLLAGPAAPLGGIVVTGAVQGWAVPGSDGPRNLAASIAAAADPATRDAGALACLDGELHAARWVSLVGATRFSSDPHEPVGRTTESRITHSRITQSRIERLADPPPRPPAAPGEPESTVALIKVYPGIESQLLYSAVDAGARGIVLEGTGAGNVPVSLFVAIGELTGWGVPVVVASRCHGATEGAAGMAAKVGAISAGDLAPVKARCALMVALGAGTVAGVQDYFDGIRPCR